MVRSSRSYQVPFAHFTLTSTLYDIDVPGYKTETKNRLRLFDLDSVDADIITDGIDFDKTDIARNLTLFLYPDDSDKQGELLCTTWQTMLSSKSMIPTHLWLSQK